MNLAELAHFWHDQLAALDASGSGGPGTAALRADIHTDLARLGHALGSPEQQVLEHLRIAASEHHRIFCDPTAEPSLRTGARAELALAVTILAGSAAQRIDIARAVRATGGGTQARGRVAEALAALLLGESPPPVRPVESTKVFHLLAACDAIATGDATGFLAALTAALATDDDAPSTDRMLALTELTVCRLAMERGLPVSD